MNIKNEYNGKNKQLYSSVKNESGLKYCVFLSTATLIIKIDNDGNVEVSLEPL